MAKEPKKKDGGRCEERIIVFKYKASNYRHKRQLFNAAAILNVSVSKLVEDSINMYLFRKGMDALPPRNHYPLKGQYNRKQK